MTRLVVTGTRLGRFDVGESLRKYVEAFGTPELVILGDAKAPRKRADGALSLVRSVDQLARIHCETHGLAFRVFSADWDQRGVVAGPERNQRMIDAARRGDHLLAFPDEDSRGTWDCFRKGKKAGLACVVVAHGWIDRLKALHRERVRLHG